MAGSNQQVISTNGPEEEDESAGIPQWVRFEDLKIIQAEKNQIEDALVLAREEIQELEEEKEVLLREQAQALRENEDLKTAVQDLEDDVSNLLEQMNNRAEDNTTSEQINGDEDTVPNIVVDLQEQLKDSRNREQQLEQRLKEVLARNENQPVKEMSQISDTASIDGAMSTSSAGTSRPTSSEKQRKPWRPPSANGISSRMDIADGSRPGTASSQDTPDFSRMSRPQLCKMAERMQEEIMWQNACMRAVREQHRDEQLRLPKRQAEEFVFATEARAKEKELQKNMHVILDYLHKLDVPPEAPTWRQLVVMYQTCQEMTDKVIRTEGELDEALGELEMARSILGLEDGKSIIYNIRQLLSDLTDLESTHAIVREELQRTKEQHAKDSASFDEQLKLLDQQLAHQGKAYEDTLLTLERNSEQQFRDFETQLDDVEKAKETLSRELDFVARNIERCKDMCDHDTLIQTRLQSILEHVYHTQETNANPDNIEKVSQQTKSSGQQSSSSSFAKGNNTSTELSPVRKAIRRPPQDAPEIVGASGVVSSQAHSTLHPEGNKAPSNLQDHMVRQERRHQEELRNLLRHVEDLHARQKERLKEVAALHDSNEDELYQRMLKLEIELEAAIKEKDLALSELRVAEASIQRLQAATNENHQRALELEANFEAEMQGLQEVLQKEKKQHEAEVVRLRQHLDTNADVLARECRSLEKQLEQQEQANQEKDREILRLMGEFRSMRESHAKQFEQLEHNHEDEMTAVIQRHETELLQQANALREAYETVQALAGQEKTASDHERTLNNQVNQLEQDLAELAQKHTDERDEIYAEHQRELAQMQEDLDALQMRTSREREELEHDLEVLQGEVASQQDRLQALSTALSLKEEELLSARETFEEERKTFKDTNDRLKKRLEDIEADAALQHQQHATEVREVNANLTRQSQVLEQTREAKSVLEDRVANLQKDLAETRSQLDAELASERDTHRESIANERAQRNEIENAYRSKIAALVEEGDGLRRELEKLETQMRDAKVSTAKLSDEASSEVAKLKVRHAAEIERLQGLLRTSENDRTEYQSELNALRESVRRYYSELMRKQPAGDAQAKDPVEQLRSMVRVYSECAQQRDSIEAKLRESDKAAKDYRQQVDALRADVEGKEEEVSQLQSADRVSRSNLAALQTRVNTLTDRSDALERENNDLRARISSLQDELTQQASNGAANQAQLGAVLDSVKQGFATEKQNFHKQVEGLRGELYDAQDRINDLRAHLRDGEAATDKVKSELSTAVAERDGLRQALQTETARREKVEDDLAHVQREAARLYAEVSEALAQAKNANGELERTAGTLNAVQTELDRVTVENAQLKEDIGRIKGDLERAETQISDLEATKQRHRNNVYELDVLRREVDEQRKELEQAQQTNLQQKAQANREKRSHAAVVADLERQVEVLNARHAKEREALVNMDTSLRQMSEEKAKAERDITRHREMSKNLQAQLLQEGAVLRDKERQIILLKKRVTALEDDLAKLQLQKRTLESRSRRDQSRLLSDVQRHLEGHDRSMRALDKVRDQSSTLMLSGTSSDSRLGNLSTQLRRFESHIRHDDVANDSSVLSTAFSNTPQTQRFQEERSPFPPQTPVLSSTLTKANSSDQYEDKESTEKSARYDSSQEGPQFLTES